MASGSAQRLSLHALTAMLVGSMVGASIFKLPVRFDAATGPFGAIIAWAIAGSVPASSLASWHNHVRAWESE